MLRLHMLNVGHGDSLVLEYDHGDGTVFGVIDSNLMPGQATPKALNLLVQKGVDRLEFLALTHPHRDHVAGLGVIANAFKGKIGLFLSHPVPRDDRAKALKNMSAAQLKRTSEPQRTFFSEFLRFLLAAEASPRWESPDGLDNKVFADKFTSNGLSVSVLLPAANMKSSFYSDMESGRLDFGGEKQNDLSLVFQISYAGVTLVLGGDASEKGWLYRARHVGRPVNARVAKLPHHGSLHDCAPRVLDHIYERAESESSASGGALIALISANGKSHPSAEVLKDLRERGIVPYCTSRARICDGAAAIPQLITDPDLDAALLRSIRAYATDNTLVGACQGDVTVEISPNGEVFVKPQYNTPCGFRRSMSIPIS